MEDQVGSGMGGEMMPDTEEMSRRELIEYYASKVYDEVWYIADIIQSDYCLLVSATDEIYAEDLVYEILSEDEIAELTDDEIYLIARKVSKWIKADLRELRRTIGRIRC